jgi:quinol-cytochrome oxidoreductase complex cytochrome b subunit
LISSLIHQIISGMLLALHYTSDISHSYSSVIHIIQDITYGWYLHYLHSIGSSIILGVMYLHIGRSLYIGSFMYNTNLWLSGLCSLIFLMLIAFLGYVLIWGMMSYWGGTVITNLLSLIPCLIECICGGFYVSNPTLKRFFIFHIIIAFLILALFIIHLYYLHGQSSTCPLGYTTNNLCLSLIRVILIKDCYGYHLMMCIYTFQLILGIYNICHPDNHIEVNSLVTPFHIIPEWYFLSFYTILKVIPYKLLGLIFFLTSLMIICIVSEVKNVCNISRLISVFSNNDNLFISYLFLMIFYQVWIGVQITQDIYLL